MKKIALLMLVGWMLYSQTYAAQTFEKGILKFTVLEQSREESQADSVVKVSSIDRLTALSASLFGKVLTIPGYVEHNGCKYQVRKVDDEAFSHCDYIEDIIIEEGVEEIGEAAFSHCFGLKSLSLPSTVNHIDLSSFTMCANLEVITVAKENKFFDSRENCNAIINSKDNELFLGCKTTVIPNSVTSIGEIAFSGCVYLTNIIIPEGVEKIGACAFFDCVSLKRIDFPSTLTSLGKGTFSGCSALKSIDIPENVNKIEGHLFNGCLSLTTIRVDKKNQVYDSRQGCNAIIETTNNRLISACSTTRVPKGVEEIGELAFRGVVLTQIEIPESVNRIHERAFNGSEILSAKIGKNNSVYYMPDGSNTLIEKATKRLAVAFHNPTITDDVEIIGKYAFSHCRLPRIMVIPEGVKEIEENAFSYTTGIANVFFPKSMEQIGRFAFAYSTIYTLDFKSPLKEVEPYTFMRCDNLQVVSMPEGTEAIRSGAFAGCQRLCSVTLPNSLKQVDKHAFVGTPCNDAIRRLLDKQ